MPVRPRRIFSFWSVVCRGGGELVPINLPGGSQAHPTLAGLRWINPPLLTLRRTSVDEIIEYEDATKLSINFVVKR